MLQRLELEIYDVLVVSNNIIYMMMLKYRGYELAGWS